MYVDIYHYLHTYCKLLRGLEERSSACGSGWVPSTYLHTYSTYVPKPAQKKIAGTDPGTSTRPELPGSVPDFFAGSNLKKKDDGQKIIDKKIITGGTTDSKSIALFYQNRRFLHGRCKKSQREVYNLPVD